jgi:adenosylcobyric acid synthase
MIQGTGSHVGKSVIVTALCRFLRQEGLRVAPFKSQNMSNNSYVTRDGGEIGRAQGVQAEAAGVSPTVDMNPILLKPNSDTGAQVVVRGRPFKTLSAREYQFHTLSLLPLVHESLQRLRDEFDVVVIEGAGSPAEVNLQEYDIANMRIAALAEAPVILVGDIDRGGVFASLIGTLELLPVQDRSRIRAFLINKFRGDVSLLAPGLEFLERRTGIPTLGVLPYKEGLDLLEEDGLSDERIRRNRVRGDPDKISIDVVWFPRISNFTDFAPLDREPDVQLTYLRNVPHRFPDLLILPGTKSTIADLKYLRTCGFEDWIRNAVENGVTVIGICGGYQMLGREILDPLSAESDTKKTSGLDFFPTRTVFSLEKETRQIRALHLESQKEVTAYEIHMGETTLVEDAPPVFEITHGNPERGKRLDGCSARGGQIWGTYLHGLFEDDGFRAHLLRPFRERKGLKDCVSEDYSIHKEKIYNELAEWIRENINTRLFHQILENLTKSG